MIVALVVLLVNSVVLAVALISCGLLVSCVNLYFGLGVWFERMFAILRAGCFSLLVVCGC